MLERTVGLFRPIRYNEPRGDVMITRSQKTVGPDSPVKGNETAQQQGADNDDACRCKEASEMTPRQLLGLMMRDLAFWKKAKKE
jgi:hypothetical protein